MNVQLNQEHEWLKQLVVNWRYQAEMLMGPDQPPQVCQGQELVRMLGDAWLLCEGQGQMPNGDTGLMLMTIGFDMRRQRFTGSFIGSMMTHLWLYDGQRQGNVLTLNSQGPVDCEGNDQALADYQDIIELTGDDQRTLTSQQKDKDGNWQRFMVATYQRV